jgi:hypothetical protein
MLLPLTLVQASVWASVSVCPVVTVCVVMVRHVGHVLKTTAVRHWAPTSALPLRAVPVMGCQVSVVA